MLRVKTYLATSTIPGAGVGLFAAEPIKAGTVVWCFDKGFDQVIDLDDLPKEARDIFMHSLCRYAYYLPEGRKTYVFAVDDGRFVNHSKTPNLIEGEPVFTRQSATVASRDIAAGEELFEDYDLLSPADPILGWQPGDGYLPGKRTQAFFDGKMTADELINGV